MQSSKDKKGERQKKYKYYKQTRGEYEIELTNKLTHCLSQLNIKALQVNPLRTSPSKSLKKEDILYVCLPGAPPFPNQFAFLELPGESLFFPFSCFQKGKTEQELIQFRSQFDEQAKILHQKINNISKTKRLVFVCHSYGCYVFTIYCQMFKTDRIVGIIDVGGAPIRFYPAIEQQISIAENLTLDSLLENLDTIYDYFTSSSKKNGIKVFQNKYTMLGLARSIISGVGFKDMFQHNRNLPKVLKCFIFGRKDATFPEVYLNQKATYYTYKNKFNEQYNNRLKKTYLKYFGRKCDNVQQKFIFSIEGALHAVHVQKKFKDLIANIVDRYLSFIEQVHNQMPAL